MKIHNHLIIALCVMTISCGKIPSDTKRVLSSNQFDHENKLSNPLIDTTRTFSLSLLGNESSQVILCRLIYRNWDAPIQWSQSVLMNGDTLIRFDRSFALQDIENVFDVDGAVDKDSLLSHINHWFFHYMGFPKTSVINSDDDRLETFKQSSLGCFSDSYHEMGYSDQTIDSIYNSFWLRHSGKTIICIEPPIEPIPGGDEALYVYDSLTNRIVEFYHP